MQLLSQGAQYTISAIIALAREPMGKAVSAGDLARPLNCPAAYLSQTLARLVPHKIIDTRRGLNGGVYLLKEPKDIRLIDIVNAIDGSDFFEKCFLGIPGCGHIEPCPFHETWANMRTEIQMWLENTTIEDASSGMTEEWFDLRLKFDRRR
ncbi:transcriptional regulator, BadM/Rrf2 family [Cyclonatronum proteinivorum]|uniref:Transcriptional regulator, BadM/Rrf2 family n=1 Tax=Cyclonatronum proteinivorum TaxID=1457365 RepID=A0A345UGH0_9BACT|nr:Rrf2 family transcriptional regulator [Cyclonatronum proteinivorum]AXI99571.1 transcriptional regulator, BadM/Rrf2 family [Cyclonatronum proteinivorum]